MMDAAYRACRGLSTHILCLLRLGQAGPPRALTPGLRARAGAIASAVHAQRVAAVAHAGPRAGANRGHAARRECHERHERRADARADHGRPLEKPRRAAADQRGKNTVTPARSRRHGPGEGKAGAKAAPRTSCMWEPRPPRKYRPVLDLPARGHGNHGTPRPFADSGYRYRSVGCSVLTMGSVAPRVATRCDSWAGTSARSNMSFRVGAGLANLIFRIGQPLAAHRAVLAGLHPHALRLAGPRVRVRSTVTRMVGRL
jgi:hypothetical protein